MRADMTVVVFGSVTWDVAAFADRLPKPGETLLGRNYITGLGGKGANQAAAAVKLGAPTKFFGRIGDDQFGQDVIAAFDKFNLDSSGVLIDPEVATALGVILVDANGENAIIQAAGANRRIDETDVVRASQALEGAKALLLQFEIPLEITLSAARAGRKAGAAVILDPAPAPSDGIAGSVLMAVDIITPNEVEAETYVGFRPYDKKTGIAAAVRLVDIGAPAAIVTMGANGTAWATAGGESGFQPVFRVDAIDTVGAGDCFNGALAVALTEGLALPAAIRFASVAAAISTTRSGAANSAATHEEVDRLLNINC
jgi:ribokinase